MCRRLDGTMRHFTPGQTPSWLPSSDLLLLFLLCATCLACSSLQHAVLLLRIVGQLLLR
jgi:hypothetical protein